jgi:hypothetical protein
VIKPPREIKIRVAKIIGGGIFSAFVGSSMGIAAMGSAIAGTIPLGLLGAYLMYLWTRGR